MLLQRRRGAVGRAQRLQRRGRGGSSSGARRPHGRRVVDGDCRGSGGSACRGGDSPERRSSARAASGWRLPALPLPPPPSSVPLRAVVVRMPLLLLLLLLVLQQAGVGALSLAPLPLALPLEPLARRVTRAPPPPPSSSSTSAARAPPLASAAAVIVVARPARGGVPPRVGGARGAEISPPIIGRPIRPAAAATGSRRRRRSAPPARAAGRHRTRFGSAATPSGPPSRAAAATGAPAPLSPPLLALPLLALPAREVEQVPLALLGNGVDAARGRRRARRAAEAPATAPSAILLQVVRGAGRRHAARGIGIRRVLRQRRAPRPGTAASGAPLPARRSRGRGGGGGERRRGEPGAARGGGPAAAVVG